MPVVKNYKWSTIDEVSHFLEGGIFGGSSVVKPRPGGPPGITDLVGRTLTFLQPAGSVTFVASSQPNGFLEYLEIKAQIEAAVPGVLVKNMQSGKFCMIESAPTTGLVLAAGNVGGFASVDGTVDLNTLIYGAGGDLDTLTLSLEINTVAQPLITFAAPANRGQVISQINAVIANALASVNPANKLHVQTTVNGPTKKVKVLGGTSLVVLGLTVNQTGLGSANNDANSKLGFPSDANSVGRAYTSPYTGSPPTPPYYLNSYIDNNNSHVIVVFE